jgi:hypothetical protein
MTTHEAQIREIVGLARARWRRERVAHAVIRASLAGAGVLGAALVAVRLFGQAPLSLLLVGAATVIGGVAAAVWGLAPLRHIPSDAQVARFVEEHVPELDDRLVSAVDALLARRTAPPALAAAMMADAAARASRIDLDRVVPADALRRIGIQASAALALLVAMLVVSLGPARSAWDAAALTFFPSQVNLQVSPGDARVVAGQPLTIEARLIGNRAPVVPQVQIAAGADWRPAGMRPASSGGFRLALPAVNAPFTYRVVAGAVVSRTYAVSVLRAPRVARIDLEYTYPAGLRLPPRTEVDAGDIFAPAGTNVRVRVHTDRPAATGRLSLAGGHPIALTAEAPTVLSADLKLVDNDSYRVALADREGLASTGDTEYFIRILQDRPPEVHITQPAADRSVTPLAEVDVEAEANDDYGIAAMELVYSVRGGPEKALAFPIPPHASSVTGHRTLYLEDLGVAPGDFVSYYARARDLTRGARSSEARSDIFFLEVRPFEQEFALAQSQSMAGSGYSGSIDDLVNVQKQVVVATWKLDRRSSASGARSEQDIHAVSKTESDLKARVEQTSSSFRESTMRDPRRPEPAPGQPRAGEVMPEEDSMAAAAREMGQAVQSLDQLSTSAALPPELEALNHLLKAQAQVKKRQIARQQAGAGGPGNNNRNYDVSTLFDKELQRQQQTNYETPTSAEQRQDADADELAKIQDLARRQDELVRRQEELSRREMTAEELKRQLEKLTREQSELRQQAEELARRMSERSGQEGRQGADQQSERDQQRPQGQQRQQGQQGQPGRQKGGAGRAGENAGRTGQGGRPGRDMRDVSDAMREAANGLRRQDPKQASADGSRALEKLKDLERQLRQSQPDEQRRELGEMQLESRELADAQRQVASELSKVGQTGASTDDALRRLAGEQERLANRARRLQEGLQRVAGTPAASSPSASSDARRSAAGAARDMQQQKTAERMQQSAEALRAASDSDRSDAKGRAGDRKSTSSEAVDPQSQAEAQQQLARSLDRVADALAGATGDRDAESRKLSEQMTRARQLRDELNRLQDQLRNTQATRGTMAPPSDSSGATKAAGRSGRAGEGQSGGGGAGTDLQRLRDEYARRLREAEDLVRQLRREDPSLSQSGEGFTFEGQGMTLSAPGTEAFKQDFAKWDELRRQATRALESAESSLSKKLQEAQARDRLAAGVDDAAPAGYRQQVNSYFKALATRKKR